MKKQNSKEDSDLTLNHYTAANFKCYFYLLCFFSISEPYKLP